MVLKIKEAQKEDWQILQKLNSEVFIHDKEFDDDLDLDWPTSEKGVEYYKQLANGKYSRCYIARASNEPVGYIALGSKDFGYRKGKFVELENMGVLPGFRSKGIGHDLIEKAKAWAKSQKATKIYVSAYWGNKKAIEFYQREDFLPIDEGLELTL